MSSLVLRLAVVVTLQRFSAFADDCYLSRIFYLACSLRAYCSCFSARDSGLSTVGRFLTNSVAVMLSSLGSLSLPLLESPLPAFTRSLSFWSWDSKFYLIVRALLLKTLLSCSASEGGSSENYFLVGVAFGFNLLIVVAGSFSSSLGTLRFA